MQNYLYNRVCVFISYTHCNTIGIIILIYIYYAVLTLFPLYVIYYTLIVLCSFWYLQIFIHILHTYMAILFKCVIYRIYTYKKQQMNNIILNDTTGKIQKTLD